MLVGGAICGGLALNKENMLKSKCDGTTCTNEERKIEESRDHLAVANVALLVAGGAVAAAGVVLILVSKLKKRENRPSPWPPQILSGLPGLP